MSRTIADFLSRHPFFGGLSPVDIERVRRAMLPRRYERNQILFHKGDRCDGIYFIVDGLVRLSIMAADGRELTLRLSSIGEAIGEIAAIDEGPRSTDGSAVMRTDVLVLAPQDFRQFIDEMPVLRRTIMRQLCMKLRQTTDQLEGVALMPLGARLARLFLALARSAGVKQEGEFARFTLSLSQRDIASMVGASRPRVNQVLVGWHEAGIVRRQGASAQCRIPALERLMHAEA